MSGRGAGIFFIVADKEIYGVMCISNNGVLELAGGTMDDTDKTFIHTAVRETMEELGIYHTAHDHLLKFIMDNEYHVVLDNEVGIYILYVVRLMSFDFSTANLAAEHRLKQYNKMRLEYMKPYVEMREYIPIRASDITAKIFIDDMNIRHRDKLLLHDERLIRYVSQINNMPIFPYLLDYTVFAE